MSFTELLDWIEFLEQEKSAVTKDDYYQAQIAAEVRRSWVEKPHQVRLEDFLVRTKPEETTWKEKMQKSKQAWASALGMAPAQLN